ncbi:glycosyltransferase family 2 protein [Pedobacter sp. MW01-1-1]|uniref:glycosyltransferase family 2 protein n=1 Tax=Pedobacter sp. MW01-1-1 TaxID=3383027 RepID=UPI003FF0CC24
MNEIIHFPTISLLVTHYNRSKSLERLLAELQKAKCQFGDVVVSDDGSKREHLDYLKELQRDYSFRIIETPVNRGLGNNINKGQAAVKTPYTLYIQEDFIPLDNFNKHIQDGLNLLEEYSDFDMVRFYAYNKYPYLKGIKNGFSEMLFKWWYPGLDKFAFYSDHPHLRRANFVERFGPYLEGTSGDKTEFAMMMSVLKQGGKSFFFDEHKSVLEQVNSSSEPSTMTRNKWRNSTNFFVKHIRTLYRYWNCYTSLYLRNLTQK